MKQQKTITSSYPAKKETSLDFYRQIVQALKRYANRKITIILGSNGEVKMGIFIEKNLRSNRGSKD